MVTLQFGSLKDGPIQGKTMDPDELAQAMGTCFEKLGWDSERVPSGERLAALEIVDYS